MPSSARPANTSEGANSTRARLTRAMATRAGSSTTRSRNSTDLLRLAERPAAILTPGPLAATVPRTVPIRGARSPRWATANCARFTSACSPPTCPALRPCRRLRSRYVTSPRSILIRAPKPSDSSRPPLGESLVGRDLTSASLPSASRTMRARTPEAAISEKAAAGASMSLRQSTSTRPVFAHRTSEPRCLRRRLANSRPEPSAPLTPAAPSRSPSSTRRAACAAPTFPRCRLSSAPTSRSTFACDKRTRSGLPRAVTDLRVRVTSLSRKATSAPKGFLGAWTGRLPVLLTELPACPEANSGKNVGRYLSSSVTSARRASASMARSAPAPSSPSSPPRSYSA